MGGLWWLAVRSDNKAKLRQAGHVYTEYTYLQYTYLAGPKTEKYGHSPHPFIITMKWKNNESGKSIDAPGSDELYSGV